jgi:hypothetical protein
MEGFSSNLSSRGAGRYTGCEVLSTNFTNWMRSEGSKEPSQSNSMNRIAAEVVSFGDGCGSETNGDGSASTGVSCGVRALEVTSN